MKIERSIASDSEENAHVANSTGVSWSYPSIAILAPVIPPTVLYPPALRTIVPDDQNSMVLLLTIASVENTRRIILQIVPVYPHRHRPSPQLSQNTITVSLVYLIKGGNFKCSSFFLAFSSLKFLHIYIRILIC